MKTVYIVASAAPPVLHLGEFIDLALRDGWQPCVILTPTAATWVDTEELAALTGQPVRVYPRLPHEQDPLPKASAIVAAPLTFNTLNKWAQGISDTLALGILNEALGLDVPITAAPCIKSTLRKHPAYRRSITELHDAGVNILDPDTVTIRQDKGFVTIDWPQILRILQA